MPNNEKGGPDQAANPASNYQGDVQSTTSSELLWNAAYRFCCACGEQRMDVAYARCGTCLDEPLKFCPCCGHDLADLRDLEVRWAFKSASTDVCHEWVAGRRTQKWWDWQQVLKHRAKAGAV